MVLPCPDKPERAFSLANKPRDYKAEYARRIARGMERGKTRQEARGHRPKEHVERKAREIERYGLTLEQLRSVKRWAAKRNKQIADSTQNPNDVAELAAQLGWEWFQQYRNTWNEARATYRREIRSGRYASRGEGYLQYLTESVSASDVSWLYYH